MDLLLTLGHNSSYISIDEGEIIGYEQERFDRLKSSSKYPIDAFNECVKHLPLQKREGQRLYISHWFDNSDLDTGSENQKSKYIDYSHIDYLRESFGFEVVHLDHSFTHHDAHANAAVGFLREKLDRENLQGGHVFVADGFGNRQEVFSVYSFDLREGKTTLTERFYGYENSLGLFYQYAASYCGMVENQDEYKFLGYESKILDILNFSQVQEVKERSKLYAQKWVEKLIESNQVILRETEYVDTGLLGKVKSGLYTFFDKLISEFWFKKDSNNIRTFIGFFVQYTVEAVHSIREHLINAMSRNTQV